MKSLKTPAQIESISSVSLMISSDISSSLKQEGPLNLCIKEFNLINKSLAEKVQILKLRENEIENREKHLLKLCNSVDKFIQSEVSVKSAKTIKETQDRLSDLEKKYNSLTKDNKRLQCSFNSINSQNRTLKQKLDEHIMAEEMMAKDRNKLACKIAVLSSNNSQHVYVQRKSVSVQTDQRSASKNTRSPPIESDSERRQNATSSCVPILYELWLQMFQWSVEDLFAVHINETGRPKHSFTDICLFIIPMSIDYLRTNLQANVDVSLSPLLRKRLFDDVNHHIAMLYWSLVYLDIGRIPLRTGMVSPLTRIGEELAHIFLSKSAVPIKKSITDDDDSHAITVLLVVRCVNQVDLLSLMLLYLADLTNRQQSNMAAVLLSKYMLVPLLCRWTSSDAHYSTLYPRMLSILLDSLTRHIPANEQRGPMKSLTGSHSTSIKTGFDQLVFLITKLPLNVTETRKSSVSHPLVFLLDILHTSKAGERDKVMEIFDQILTVREIKQMCRDLGIVGIICNLISQYKEPASSCVAKLRSTLAQLTD